MTTDEAEQAMDKVVEYFKQLEEDYIYPTDDDWHESPEHHRKAREFARRVLKAANVNGHYGCLLCQG